MWPFHYWLWAFQVDKIYISYVLNLIRQYLWAICIVMTLGSFTWRSWVCLEIWIGNSGVGGLFVFPLSSTSWYSNLRPELSCCACRDSTSCVLFDQEEIDRWEQQFNVQQLQHQNPLERAPDAMAGLGALRIRPCPNCRQPNFKVHLYLLKVNDMFHFKDRTWPSSLCLSSHVLIYHLVVKHNVLNMPSFSGKWTETVGICTNWLDLCVLFLGLSLCKQLEGWHPSQQCNSFCVWFAVWKQQPHLLLGLSESLLCSLLQDGTQECGALWCK